MNTVILNGKELTPSKVICIGKNYEAHVKEMGGVDSPKEPVIFIKPNSAISFCRRTVFVPEELGLLHYEVELCFIVGESCKDLDVSGAERHIAGYAVGLDMTLRDLQSEAKRSGRPWALAKGFDGSFPLSEFTSSSHIADPLSLDIMLKVNGEVKQSSNTSKMIFKPADILSFASKFMTIEEGDIFMTGTPEGVGSLKHGDKVVAEVGDLIPLSVDVIRAK